MKDDNNFLKNRTSGTAKVVTLTELVENTDKTSEITQSNYSIVSDVKVKLDALIGSADLTIQDLFALQKTSIVKLNESIDTPLILMLNDKAVAYGHLVVVGENFGIKITEIVNTKST